MLSLWMAFTAVDMSISIHTYYIGTHFIIICLFLFIYHYLLSFYTSKWLDAKFCLTHSIFSKSHGIVNHLVSLLKTMASIPTSFYLIKRFTNIIWNDTDYQRMVCVLVVHFWWLCQTVWDLADISLFLSLLHSYPKLGTSHLLG